MQLKRKEKSFPLLFKNMWKTIVPEMEVLRPGWKEFLKERLDSLYISSGENWEYPLKVQSKATRRITILIMYND